MKLKKKVGKKNRFVENLPQSYDFLILPRKGVEMLVLHLVHIQRGEKGGEGGDNASYLKPNYVRIC